jgi:hypothetical protein
MFNPAIEPDLIDYKAVGALFERNFKISSTAYNFPEATEDQCFVKNSICKNWENWQRG